MTIRSANQLNQVLSQTLAGTDSNLYASDFDFKTVVVTRYKAEVKSTFDEAELFDTSDIQKSLLRHVRAVQEQAIKDLKIDDYVQESTRAIQHELDTLYEALSNAFVELEKERQRYLTTAITLVQGDNSKMGMFNTGKAEGILEALRAFDNLRKK